MSCHLRADSCLPTLLPFPRRLPMAHQSSHLVSSRSSTTPAAASAKPPSMTVKARLDRGEKFVLVDVREDREFDADHIAGAVHLGKGIIERDIEAKYPDARHTASPLLRRRFPLRPRRRQPAEDGLHKCHFDGWRYSRVAREIYPLEVVLVVAADSEKLVRAGVGWRLSGISVERRPRVEANRCPSEHPPHCIPAPTLKR